MEIKCAFWCTGFFSGDRNSSLSVAEEKNHTVNLKLLHTDILYPENLENDLPVIYRNKRQLLAESKAAFGIMMQVFWQLHIKRNKRIAVFKILFAGDLFELLTFFIKIFGN